ncbi:MAG: tRNA-(ms[2]io[6]A)-hydroxylase [Myxococcales bacterium]|nr:tRNA-(ms[2]io[6]A)-hydroxylase [Myxococcales bacterium]
MLCLHTSTQPAWLARAIAHTPDILIDHAHCERKAAANALNLLARYPDRTFLRAPLLALAREELEHFEQVLAELDRRGIALTAQAPTGYQAHLFAHVRPGAAKLLDLLLVAALIEARSCERFRLLAEHHPEPDLAALYRGLLEAEARHHGVFVRLAEHEAGARDGVRARLQELAEAECAVLEKLGAKVARIHA